MRKVKTNNLNTLGTKKIKLKLLYSQFIIKRQDNHLQKLHDIKTKYTFSNIQLAVLSPKLSLNLICQKVFIILQARKQTEEKMREYKTIISSVTTKSEKTTYILNLCKKNSEYLITILWLLTF